MTLVGDGDRGTISRAAVSVDNRSGRRRAVVAAAAGGSRGPARSTGPAASAPTDAAEAVAVHVDPCLKSSHIRDEMWRSWASAD